MKITKESKEVIKQAIKLLQGIKNPPTKNNHTLDMDKFWKLPEVKEATKLLTDAGINSDKLYKLGYIPLGMLLRLK